MTDIPTVLKDMTWEEAKPLLKAWIKDEPIEVWTGMPGRGWRRKKSHVGLSRKLAYRIPPKTPIIQQYLWDTLPEDIVAIAIDDLGNPYGYYQEVPTMRIQYWDNDLSVRDLTQLRGYDFTGVDWKDSLVLRPK
jgi:hypothetical protein